MTRTLTNIRKIQDNQERINFLKDKWKDERVFIVAPGPSLLRHNRESLLRRLEGKNVIVLKQAYDYVKEVADIHLMSVYNYQPYEYHLPETLVHWQLTAMNYQNEIHRITNEWKHRTDVMIPVYSTPWISKQQSTSFTREFRNWEAYKDGKAIWGPGIIYESGFPLALHMGARKIVTIGWDIGDLSKYGEDKMSVDQNWTAQHAEALYKIDTGGGPEREELEHTIACTKEMQEYLVSKNVQLQIISDTSPAHESIERITLDDID